MSYEPVGFKRLAQLDVAQLKRMEARFLRASAGQHSVEHEWVQEMYRLTNRLEFEAKALEYRK